MTAINMLLSVAAMPAGDVQPDKVRSLHDVGAMVVKCYHPSATYTGIEILEHPWSRGEQWKADASAVLRISYRGNVFRLNHQITIAAMQRGKEFMALPLHDSNKVPLAKDCSLKYWVSAS
ncbi:MAG: hypothetical protein ACK4FK_14595 [Ferrovibrio sp.]